MPNSTRRVRDGPSVSIAAQAGTAATALGDGASAVLPGVDSVATTVAGYGTIVTQGRSKLVNEFS